MFGGSTLLLFLLCYCCQKKIQEDNLTLAQINRNADTSREPLTNIATVSDNSLSSTATGHTVIPPIIIIPPPSPPPTYDSVMKKDSLVPLCCNEENPPPPYEEAVANLQSEGFV